MIEQFRVVRRTFFGAVTVAQPAAALVTEEQADRLAHAGACFDIVNGRAVQIMRPVGTEGFAPINGMDEK
jgi:hypothetical protein